MLARTASSDEEKGYVIGCAGTAIRFSANAVFHGLNNPVCRSTSFVDVMKAT